MSEPVWASTSSDRAFSLHKRIRLGKHPTRTASLVAFSWRATGTRHEMTRPKVRLLVYCICLCLLAVLPISIGQAYGQHTTIRFTPNSVDFGSLFDFKDDLIDPEKYAEFHRSRNQRLKGAVKLALVMGNDAYRRLQPLDSPSIDAKFMADYFLRSGYYLIGGRDNNNLDEKSMISLINDLTSRVTAEKKQKRSVVVAMFYSGHGFSSAKRNYLAPIDLNFDAALAPVLHPDLSIAAITRGLEKAGADVTIFFVNACRNTINDRYDHSFVSEKAAQNAFVGYGTTFGSYAYDGIGRELSVYTQALLRQFKTSEEYFIEDFHLRVSADTLRQTTLRQAPIYASGDRARNLPISLIFPDPEKKQWHPASSDEISKESVKLYKSKKRSCFNLMKGPLLHGRNTEFAFLFLLHNIQNLHDALQACSDYNKLHTANDEFLYFAFSVLLNKAYAPAVSAGFKTVYENQGVDWSAYNDVISKMKEFYEKKFGLQIKSKMTSKDIQIFSSAMIAQSSGDGNFLATLVRTHQERERLANPDVIKITEPTFLSFRLLLLAISQGDMAAVSTALVESGHMEKKLEIIEKLDPIRIAKGFNPVLTLSGLENQKEKTKEERFISSTKYFVRKEDSADLVFPADLKGDDLFTPILQAMRDSKSNNFLYDFTLDVDTEVTLRSPEIILDYNKSGESVGSKLSFVQYLPRFDYRTWIGERLRDGYWRVTDYDLTKTYGSPNHDDREGWLEEAKTQQGVLLSIALRDAILGVFGHIDYLLARRYIDLIMSSEIYRSAAWKYSKERFLANAVRTARVFRTGLDHNGRRRLEASQIDPAFGARVLQFAVSHGSAWALYDLATAYRDGAGASLDPQQYLRLLVQSASQGHHEAQYELGISIVGRATAAAETALGRVWLCKAAAQGHELSLAELKQRAWAC